MIDIHTHLLPGVDDGSRTMEQSVEVLGRFAAEGVRTVVCTPHLRASRAAEAPRARNEAFLAELRARMGDAIDLRLGWEIMLDRPGMELSSGVLRLATSSAVLVEFPHAGVPPRSAFELARLRDLGLVPVLAHPERYLGASVSQVREWRSAGAVMQGDATYLLGSGDKARLARALLEEGLIDLLASDNHGDQRTLRAARDWLLEMGATEHAELLTGRNAERLLNDETMTQVPPLQLPRGFAARLRELLFGRRS